MLHQSFNYPKIGVVDSVAKSNHKNSCQRLSCQCKSFIVCVYLFASLAGTTLAITVFRIDRFSSFLLSALSKPGHPHHKKTNDKKIARPQNINILINRFSCQVIVLLWWRWRESNPRPEHVSITFIELGVMVSFRLCYRILGSYHHIKEYDIIHYDTCQHIYLILPGNLFYLQ